MATVPVEKEMEVLDELRAHLRGKRRFLLGGHLLPLQGINELFHQFEVGREMRGVLQLEEVYLSLHLVLLTVALDAVLVEGGAQEFDPGIHLGMGDSNAEAREHNQPRQKAVGMGGRAESHARRRYCRKSTSFHRSQRTYFGG